MKKGWICFLLACHLGMAYGQKNVIDEIVWVVGDEAILLSDVTKGNVSTVIHTVSFRNRSRFRNYT